MLGCHAGLGGAEVLRVVLVQLPVLLTSVHCQYRPHEQLFVLTLATTFWLNTLERVIIMDCFVPARFCQAQSQLTSQVSVKLELRLAL